MSEIKLNIGCGNRPRIKGFLGVDIIKYDSVDWVAEAHDLSFAEDETVVAIYASHVLEYYDRYEAVDVLKEWNRILRPSGEIWISVPNFEILSDLYTYDNFPLYEIIGPLFGRMEGKNGQKIYHKTVYDASTLANMLIDTGFSKPQEYHPKEEGVPGDDYSMAKKGGKLISINMKAIKP